MGRRLLRFRRYECRPAASDQALLHLVSVGDALHLVPLGVHGVTPAALHHSTSLPYSVESFGLTHSRVPEDEYMVLLSFPLMSLLSLIHICRCRRAIQRRSRGLPYH